LIFSQSVTTIFLLYTFIPTYSKLGVSYLVLLFGRQQEI